MDKYEFNTRVEQLRKLVSKGDYATALKIADTIDWRKVRNANLLAMVSEVYEKNEEYHDAKDILLLAYERTSIGKRFLYKLTELALKDSNTDEAETYYREFCEIAGDDTRQYLMRYMILKERKAPIEQMINTLERYTAEELDEKWMYELAELYHQAGNEEKCVSTCDKIMLMFGLGKYVDKAMELKIQYAPLTTYQMDLFENREKYEAKLREVQQSFQDVIENEDEYVEGVKKKEGLQVKEVRTRAVENSKPEKAPVKEETEQQVSDEKEAEIKEAEETQEAPENTVNTTVIEEEVLTEPEKAPAKMNNHLMVEAKTPEKGLELALETLKKIQRETGVKNPIAKISGSKLNKKGILANADKLDGKDIIIEEAGDLLPEIIDELEQFMAEDHGDIRVILIDNPRQMEMLHEQNPTLARHFECIAGSDAFQKNVEPEVVVQEKEAEEQLPEEEEAPEVGYAESEEEPEDEAEMEEEPEDDEELDIDEFAQYACDYAAQIDCNVSGKSMLALYERIEILEEDGIPLTRANAEALIEEAADNAEKKTFKSLFSSKYDKEGRLILKEEHFIS